MSKTVAIVQSNYVPWKGYFDMINQVDEFILLDDVQYTKRDWRNRNKIKTESGLVWLSIAVKVKGKYYQKINETQIDDRVWAEQHWNKLSHVYRHAKYYDQYQLLVKSWFNQAATMSYLSDVNYFFIKQICQLLDIDTKISRSSDYMLKDGQNERLLQLCLDAGADNYLSGPAAQSYLDESLFIAEGVKVTWMDYAGYPPYPQLFGDFEPGVSILDVIFNCGPQARQYVFKSAV